MVSDDSVWDHFLGWLPSAPPAGNAPAVLEHYRKALTTIGVAEDEITRRLGVILQRLRDRADGWRLMFNNIYASKGAGFSTSPNLLLAEAVSSLKPGRALDIGMGQGRNSVYLATRGWDVTGFDVSDGGLSIARDKAANAGVTLKTVHSAESDFDYGTDVWDLIAFLYGPFQIESAKYAQRLQNSMKVGGSLVVEGFSVPLGAPNRPSTAVDPDALLDSFRAWRLVHFEDKVGQPDWGPPDGPRRRIVKMIAENRVR